MDDNLIPLAGIFCVFGLPILGWIIVRVLAHRERMEMLRRGIAPPMKMRGWRRGRYGEQWMGPGMQMGAMNAPPPNFNYPVDDQNSPQCMLRKGIVTAMVGFALLIGLSFIGYRGGDGIFNPATIHPGPWLLGGLIPMFVGIAQILIAVLSGAQFGLRMPNGPPAAPPPQPPPFRSYGGPSQPGQPGPRYEELARPVPPPDRT